MMRYIMLFLGNAGLFLFQILNMSSNSIKGSLSPKILYMTNLVGLDMSKNLLTGTMPTTLTLLTKLTYLDFSNNKISVSYPS